MDSVLKFLSGPQGVTGNILGSLNFLVEKDVEEEAHSVSHVTSRDRAHGQGQGSPGPLTTNWG